MAGPAHLRVGVTPAAKAAEAAWERYASTCRMGGTPAERAWSFRIALEAQSKVSRLELAQRSGR